MITGAETAATTAAQALVEGISGIGTQMNDIIVSVLPVGLPIAGVVMAIKFGFRLFRSIVA